MPSTYCLNFLCNIIIIRNIILFCFQDVFSQVLIYPDYHAIENIKNKSPSLMKDVFFKCLTLRQLHHSCSMTAIDRTCWYSQHRKSNSQTFGSNALNLQMHVQLLLWQLYIVIMASQSRRRQSKINTQQCFETIQSAIWIVGRTP